MTSLTKFGSLLVILFQIIVQQQNVEGLVWMERGIIVTETMKEAVNLLNKLRHISNNDSSAANEIMGIINQVSTKIDHFSNIIRSNDPGKVILAKYEKSSFQENIKEIKLRYNRMKELSQLIGKDQTSTKEKFSELNVLTGPHSVSSIISNIFFEYLGLSSGTFSIKTPLLNITSTEFRGARTNNEMFLTKTPLLNMISTEFHKAKTNNECLSNSAQQYFFSDYLELTFIGIKAYLINKFSWTILGNKHFKTFEVKEENFLQEHGVRLSVLNMKFSEVMSDASMEIRRCDPLHWEEGVSYEQLTRLVQGYVVNEMNLSPSHSCAQNCEYYKNVNVSCYRGDKYCQENRAHGNVISCEADGRNTDILVCPSKSRARRLDYFQGSAFAWFSHYGKRNLCQYPISFFGSILSGFVFCTACFCLIDEKSDESDRFFNLREVVSDVDENKVVTGVRFLKKNRIMYLQIQQGELGPIGSIKKNTLAWKDVEEYELNEENNGVDYFTFDNKQKSIELGEIQMHNSSFVVTGLKLSAMNFRLHLKVQFTESDFQLGKLIQPQKSSVWVVDYFLNKGKLPLWRNNEAPNVSTLAPGKNVPSANTKNYVEFTHSNKRADASQTTLPFFDIQDVVSVSPTSLSGIGLYHRGFNGYGGFIAPKIFTSNIAQYLSSKKCV